MGFHGKGNPYCGLEVNPTSVHDRGTWKCTLIFENSTNKSRCVTETKILAKVFQVPLIIKPIPQIEVGKGNQLINHTVFQCTNLTWTCFNIILYSIVLSKFYI